MKRTDIHTIITEKKDGARCHLLSDYYLKCENKKLYLCLGRIERQDSLCTLEIHSSEYDDIISEIKEKISLTEEQRLEKMMKTIDKTAYNRKGNSYDEDDITCP